MEFDPSKITEAREEIGLSPERLSNSLPIPLSGGTIRNYESGKSSPDIHTLIHIAETLGKNILFFLTESSIELDGAKLSAAQPPQRAVHAPQTATGG